METRGNLINSIKGSTVSTKTDNIITSSSIANNVIGIESGFNKGRNARLLPQTEYHERRRKGLCFTCDEKYTPKHICKNKQYKVMILEDIEEEGGEEEMVEHKVQVAESSVQNEETSIQLDFHSMVGLTSKRSMKLWGRLDDKEVMVLIESGAMHNFISQDLVTKLGLQVQETPQYLVKVGDGYAIKTQGVCKGLKV